MDNAMRYLRYSLFAIRYSLLVAVGCLLLFASALHAQTEELIPFGDMDQWVDRQIKESGIIGGATKHVYAIGPTCVITDNSAYTNMGGSPWGSSNVLARVSGITKTNTSVFPDTHGDGLCARMDTRMESVKVLGIVNITVLAAGSIFLGSMHEPIRGTKNPQKMLESGIPFTRRPAALRYDYRVTASDRPCRIRATGFGRQTDVAGRDSCVTCLLLQQRWEDDEGNIYARRIATLVVYYDQTTDWVTDATYPLIYGDASQQPGYLPQLMDLKAEIRYAVNSRGESVPIQEVEWGTGDETPTHLFIQFASSHGGAYIGSPGNSFYIDNVRLVYE